MSSELEHYNELKKKSEQLQREADRAIGAEEQLKQQLFLEFDCNSIKEAKRLLDRMEKDQEKMEKEYQETVKEFELTWKDQLT